MARHVKHFVIPIVGVEKSREHLLADADLYLEAFMEDKGIVDQIQSVVDGILITSVWWDE